MFQNGKDMRTNSDFIDKRLTRLSYELYYNKLSKFRGIVHNNFYTDVEARWNSKIH